MSDPKTSVKTSVSKSGEKSDSNSNSDSNSDPNSGPNSKAPPISFESAIEQLQMAVKKLESGELSLEDSLQYFEEGVRLTRVCQEYLTTAEQRVEVLMKINSEGLAVTQPFTGTGQRS